jgi:hypothetical protein
MATLKALKKRGYSTHHLKNCEACNWTPTPRRPVLVHDGRHLCPDCTKPTEPSHPTSKAKE